MRQHHLRLGSAVSLAICVGFSPVARGDQFDTLRTNWQTYLVAGDGIPIGMGSRDSPANLAGNARSAWSSMNTDASRTSLWSSLSFDADSSSSSITRTFSELELMALAWATPGSPLHGNADLAAAMGIELLTEEQYLELQKLGDFDTKTSSWVRAPGDIRKLGGGLFGDRRFGHVFVYHNGAQSYYSARAFRGSLRV